MYKRSIFEFLIIILFLFCLTKDVYSRGKGNKGFIEVKKKEEKSKTPYGWEEGLKKGWEGLTPPGWDNWSDKDKESWKKNLVEAKEEINLKAEKKGLTFRDRERIKLVFELAVRRGIPIASAKKIIKECIAHALTGEETDQVIEALCEGAKKLDLEILGREVVKKIRAGYRGEELARQIRIMIEERYQAKRREEEKKREKKADKAGGKR